MSFTDEEIAYMRSQRVARLATVAPDGQPDAVPVGVQFDGTYLYVPGLDITKTRKYRNVRDGNPRIALVFDDFVSVNPWTPRFLRIYGTADIVEWDGFGGRQPTLRITPTTSWSWNLEGRPFTVETNESDDVMPGLRRTVHQPPA
jgi:pyridoxamine 5'-phosphate oxidase family protein